MFHKCSLASSTGFCDDVRLPQQLLSAPAANAPQRQPPRAPPPRPSLQTRAGGAAMPRSAVGLPLPSAGLPSRRGRRRRRSPPRRGRRAPRGHSEREGGREGRPPGAAEGRRRGGGAAARAQRSLPSVPCPQQPFPPQYPGTGKSQFSFPPIRSCLPPPLPLSAPSCLWPLREEPLLSVRDGVEPVGAAAEAAGHGAGALGTIRPGSVPYPELAVRCSAGRAALSSHS